MILLYLGVAMFVYSGVVLKMLSSTLTIEGSSLVNCKCNSFYWQYAGGGSMFIWYFTLLTLGLHPHGIPHTKSCNVL